MACNVYLCSKPKRRTSNLSSDGPRKKKMLRDPRQAHVLHEHTEPLVWKFRNNIIFYYLVVQMKKINSFLAVVLWNPPTYICLAESIKTKNRLMLGILFVSLNCLLVVGWYQREIFTKLLENHVCSNPTLPLLVKKWRLIHVGLLNHNQIFYEYDFLKMLSLTYQLTFSDILNIDLCTFSFKYDWK